MHIQRRDDGLLRIRRLDGPPHSSSRCRTENDSATTAGHTLAPTSRGRERFRCVQKPVTVSSRLLHDPPCCRRVPFRFKCIPFENEAGKIDFGTASLVVHVHTSFCRIYTSHAITYPRTETALHSPPRHPSGGGRIHLTSCSSRSCSISFRWGCEPARIWTVLAFVDGEAIVRQSRESSTARFRSPSWSTTPAPLVSPPLPHWSVPQVIDYWSHLNHPIAIWCVASLLWRLSTQFLRFKSCPRHHLTRNLTHLRSGYVRH